MDASPISIPEAELNSGGRKMPLLGLGMAASPPVPPEETKRAVLQAIELGYRHFDTAPLYGTEAPLGEAVEEAISQGLIKSRKELFVTSKLWCSDAHPGLVLPALRNSLRNLKMEYLDLYLIHWPVSSKPGAHEFPIKDEDFRAMDIKAVWEEMEDCQNKGLTRCIGVCNFSCKKIADILSTAKIPPAVNQVEMNPLWQQQKLREFCGRHGILLTAYAALGAQGTIWGSNRVMASEKLKEIASARGKTIAQVCLRWAYEQGVSVLVKSFNNDRMKENLGIFDWELMDQESKEIVEIPQSRGCLGEDYISDHGPFRTIEELWDGEL